LQHSHFFLHIFLSTITNYILLKWSGVALYSFFFFFSSLKNSKIYKFHARKIRIIYFVNDTWKNRDFFKIVFSFLLYRPFLYFSCTHIHLPFQSTCFWYVLLYDDYVFLKFISKYSDLSELKRKITGTRKACRKFIDLYCIANSQREKRQLTDVVSSNIQRVPSGVFFLCYDYLLGRTSYLLIS